MSGEAASRAPARSAGPPGRAREGGARPRQAGRRDPVVGPSPHGALAVRAGRCGARHLVPRQRSRPCGRRRAERPPESHGPAAGLLAGRRRPDPDLLRPAADRAAGRSRPSTTPASTSTCRSSRCSRSATACPTRASPIAICARSPRSLRPGEPITVEVEVANEGDVAGEETVFLFVRDPVASVARPLLELKGVAKIALEPRQRAAPSASRSATDDLAFLGPDLAPRLEPGTFEIHVGPSAAARACSRRPCAWLPEGAPSMLDPLQPDWSALAPLAELGPIERTAAGFRPDRGGADRGLGIRAGHLPARRSSCEPGNGYVLVAMETALLRRGDITTGAALVLGFQPRGAGSCSGRGQALASR